MSELTSSPIFGVVLTLAAYLAGVWLNRKTKLAAFNPLLLAITLIILVLITFQIDYEDYNQGGQIVSFFLAPITVVLAVPVYKQFTLLRKNIGAVTAGLLCGNLFGMVFIILCAKLLRFPDSLAISLIPKSVTTPIGMAISKLMGGMEPVTVVSIIFTGIIGSIIGPMMYKAFRLNDKVAFGIAMGASSHAIGTAKTLEFGELEGAMSSVSMALSGIITVIMAPVLWRFLG